MKIVSITFIVILNFYKQWMNKQWQTRGQWDVIGPSTCHATINNWLSICSPSACQTGEIITSTQTALLSKQDPPIAGRKAHIFPGINKSLLSIGTFCDHGCQAIFDEKTVLVINKGSGKVMMKGKRYPCSNLYILNLTHKNKLMTEFTTPDEYFAGSVYECKSKVTRVNYHHASCWIPTQYGWVKAITKNLIHFLARPII